MDREFYLSSGGVIFLSPNQLPVGVTCIVSVGPQVHAESKTFYVDSPEQLEGFRAQLNSWVQTMDRKYGGPDEFPLFLLVVGQKLYQFDFRDH